MLHFYVAEKVNIYTNPVTSLVYTEYVWKALFF